MSVSDRPILVIFDNCGMLPIRTMAKLIPLVEDFVLDEPIDIFNYISSPPSDPVVNACCFPENTQSLEMFKKAAEAASIEVKVVKLSEMEIPTLDSVQKLGLGS